jgi:hypothetical protein
LVINGNHWQSSAIFGNLRQSLTINVNLCNQKFCFFPLEISREWQEIDSCIFYQLYNSKNYIYGKILSKNGWAVEELLAMKFAKSPSTKWVKVKFLEKDRLFSTKRKGVRKKFFYQFVFRPTVFLFSTFPLLQVTARGRKLKNEVLLHKNL